MGFLLQQPSLDRWMYPFNTSPGTRSAASVFGAVGVSGFDDRDGQFLVRFDTTSIAPAGQGAGKYNITSLTLTLTVNVGNSFFYDPTYDSYRTFFDLADSDAGRPIELFAVGYRNGYSAATFSETSSFSAGSAMSEGARNAYAAQFDASGALVDVSNSVTSGFETTPLAIGQIAGLTAGDLVPEDALVTFTIDLADPNVVAWLQSSLNAGYLEFMVTSLYATSEMASSGYPSFYTKENILNDPESGDFLAAQLGGSIAVVPEPGVGCLLALGGAAVFFWRRRHAA